MNKKAIKRKITQPSLKNAFAYFKGKNIKSLNYYVVAIIALSLLLLAALFTNGFGGATNLVAFLNKGRVGTQRLSTSTITACFCQVIPLRCQALKLLDMDFTSWGFL